jgi:hypothetical protein
MYVCMCVWLVGWLFYEITVVPVFYFMIHMNQLSFKDAMFTCKLLKQHFTSAFLEAAWRLLTNR